MNLFPIEPKFEIGTKGFNDVDDNGHKLDLLNRGEFGQRLTDLVDRTEQPLVIALDGPWGSGKSHFLKLWAGAHKLELGGKAEVIYFDAFEHDFLDDPLVSLVAKLAKDAPERGLVANAMKNVKTAAAPLLKMGARIGLAVVTAGGSEVVGAVGGAAIREIGKTAEEKIDEFWKTETTRIAAMSEFREALEALTKKEDGTTQKIVFIIDELDRCRPDYALQMLEIIKHFFTVPNVHFVLGANLTELENSVKARYGAEMNARKYLQKFVMLEMRLPSNVVARPLDWSVAEEYFDVVKGKYSFSGERIDDIANQLEALRSRAVISIRDLQRILTLISLFPKYEKGWNDITDSVCVLLAFLAVIDGKMFQRLRSGTATFGELADKLHLVRSDDQHWVSFMWHAFAFLFKSDAELIAEGADTEFVRAIKAGLARRYRFTTERQILEREIQVHFDTFTLPAP